METIVLAGSGRVTTRLGFGCSSIMGALDRKDSLRILDAAWDAGIRHFDVAPSYGFGEAEGCLGEFLAQHAGDVTVTTKFGIPSAQPDAWRSAVRGLARPVLKLLPGLKQRLRGAAGIASGPRPRRPEFNAAACRRSLELSVNALRVGHIDVFLLHEVRADDLVHDDLREFLETEVAAGKLGAFGVGTEASNIPALQAERAAYCEVLQYEWSVFDPLIAPGESFRIHHRSLMDNFRGLHQALLADEARCRRWSEHCGADLTDAEVLAGLMVKASLICNPQSVVLFSSKHPSHIERNVAIAGDAAAEEKALRLYALVRAESVVEAGRNDCGEVK